MIEDLATVLDYMSTSDNDKVKQAEQYVAEVRKIRFW